MVRTTRDESPGPGEVLVAVAGCGVCHTDLGFHYDGVPTRHPFPLTLGHEIAGTVVVAGPGAERWLERRVVVPAVIPCGECPACAAGRGAVCPAQIFPGNDVHGGFASHVRVPARGLCEVPDLDDPAVNAAGIDLASLAVVADAVTTPFQAIHRSGLAAGDLAVFVGAGGVGGFGVQIARAFGAHVVAIDVSADRLAMVAEHGAELTLDAGRVDFKALKAAVRELAKRHGVPGFRQKVFETSGTAAGQSTAFGLLEQGGFLSVVGFTPDKVTLRLSNLMAFDATAQGNWGCLPEHYPAAVGLVVSGAVAVAPFVEQRPLSAINETFEDLHAHRLTRRPVLIPD
ncbi:MAG: 6-hydroxycyclohex-1-ene-1-carbonyl-CoA dehydrogenase [Planctomycetes bacterium]|nr:6-hydroxycyclohex-1-ene-1-carbonyl-CoA dehydrogenase [Planctomycetota bacterium]